MSFFLDLTTATTTFSPSFCRRGAEKANQPQTTTTIGPGGCPHGLMETRPPPPGRQATGEEYQRSLPAPQVSLFANFLMCPPTCLRGITSCLPPSPPAAQLSSPPGVCAAEARLGEGTRGGWGGVPGAPALGVGRTAGRGLFTRRPSPPSAARTPPARPGPARPRLPRFTSLKLWDFLLRFLSENSMVRRAGRAGAAAGGGRAEGQSERRPRRRRRRWLLSPGSGSAGTKVRLLDPQGGGTSKGKTTRARPGAAAGGAGREALSRAKLPPPGRRSARPPTPAHPRLPG